MNRDIVIDITKGIGILLVILGHLVTYGSLVSSVIFSFHMPLFFVVAGILFPKNNIPKMIKNVAKYILTYYEISILGFLVTCIIPEWNILLNWKLFIYEMFFKGQPESLHVGQIWFLLAISVSLIIFRSIAFENNKEKPLNKIVIFSLIVFFTMYIQRWVLVPLKFDVACAALPFVTFGYVLKSKDNVTKYLGFSVTRKISLILGCLLIQNIIVYYNGQVNICDMNFHNPLLFIVGGINGTIMAILMAGLLASRSQIFCVSRILVYIGRNSLPIFVLHSFMLYLYEFLVYKSTGINYKIMINMPSGIVWIGFVFVSLSCLMFPVFYNCTLKVINEKITRYLAKNI